MFLGTLIFFTYNMFSSTIWPLFCKEDWSSGGVDSELALPVACIRNIVDNSAAEVGTKQSREASQFYSPSLNSLSRETINLRKHMHEILYSEKRMWIQNE